ncbi:Uncharacterised protein [Mycobacterium tuberculosis]|nr:Uncharacterised protein [Mycobacterium tuberculosis]
MFVCRAASAFRSSKPSASQNVFHCASLTAARKICSPSFTVNTSYSAQAEMRSGIGAAAWPVMAYCSMCWPTRNTLFSNSADCTSCPLPVSPRCISAAMAPMAPNMPPMMSFTLVPARSGSPGRPVM